MINISLVPDRFCFLFLLISSWASLLVFNWELYGVNMVDSGVCSQQFMEGTVSLCLGCCVYCVAMLKISLVMLTGWGSVGMEENTYKIALLSWENCPQWCGHRRAAPFPAMGHHKGRAGPECGRAGPTSYHASGELVLTLTQGVQFWWRGPDWPAQLAPRPNCRALSWHTPTSISMTFWSRWRGWSWWTIAAGSPWCQATAGYPRDISGRVQYWCARSQGLEPHHQQIAMNIFR